MQKTAKYKQVEDYIKQEISRKEFADWRSDHDRRTALPTF